MNEHEPTIRHAADVLSATAIVTSIIGWLPPVAAVLGIIWYVLQIYGWFEKRFAKRKQFKRRATDTQS